MTLLPFRHSFRLRATDVDRGLELDQQIVISRHPSETYAHVLLRVLAFLIFHEEHLEFGAGLGDSEAPDLLANDLTGRLKTWIECGRADGQHLRRVRERNHGVKVYALLASTKEREDFRAGSDKARARSSRRIDPVEVVQLDPEFMERLADDERERARWTVTIVGDHIYVDADGMSFDSELLRDLQD